MNQNHLNELKISETELEELSGVSISEITMGKLYQFKTWQDPHQLLSLFLNELLIFALTLILSLPTALLLSRKTVYSPSDNSLLFQVFGLTLIISLLLTCGWNLYMGIKTKPLIRLGNLLQEVNKYNDVVKAVEILDQLINAGNLRENLINREDVLNALTLTRESLITALRTERILRDHQDFIGRRYELFINLENNLTALMALDVTNQASEYGRLLNEALEIGMTVHQEVRKIRNSP